MLLHFPSQGYGHVIVGKIKEEFEKKITFLDLPTRVHLEKLTTYLLTKKSSAFYGT
jgi:hypothetical protein